MDEERKRPRSEALRDAHRDLLQLIQTMSTGLEPARLARDATEARAMLSMLAGKLTIHLAMEDRAMYPRLANHNSLDVRQTAERLALEMGGILEVFKGYLARWPTPEAIQHDSSRFATETNQIFDALRSRIAKEDTELFPKLDEV